ncbi:MAG: hypothetical protein KDE52_17545 [Calditrichaeota bacterium]|nr:hypothetical protein [Calditrichota bacterium]
MAIINPNIRKLLENLRKLKTAHQRLSQSSGNRRIAEQKAERAFQVVMEQLKDPQLVELLDEIITGNAQKLQSQMDDIQKKLSKNHSEIVGKEARAMQEMKMKRDELAKRLHEAELLKKEQAELIKENQSLRELLEKNHRKAVVMYDALRSEKIDRTSKKQRKRNIEKGIVSTIFGVGAIAANTQFPSLAVFSYMFALTALHKASRDFVSGDEGNPD